MESNKNKRKSVKLKRNVYTQSLNNNNASRNARRSIVINSSDPNNRPNWHTDSVKRLKRYQDNQLVKYKQLYTSLPAGWDLEVDNHGVKFYVSPDKLSMQLDYPSDEPLPLGWKTHIDKSGMRYYKHNDHGSFINRPTHNGRPRRKHLHYLEPML